MSDFPRLNRRHVDSGRVLEVCIINVAVGLVLYLIATELPHVHPVNKWWSAERAAQEAKASAASLGATVSPIYPFAALCVCLGAWLHHHTSIPSDWLNPAQAGAQLNSARVHCRIGLEDRNPPFWKAELTRVAKRVSSMLVRSGEVAMETGQHVAMYTAEAGATVRASLQRHLANQAKAKEE